DGKQVKLNGPRDLAEFLVSNKTAQRSFVHQLFEHYAKQPIGAYGEGQLDRLHAKFSNSGFNVRRLLLEIALVTVKHETESSDVDGSAAVETNGRLNQTSE
ncbi:MAG: hypothetical protein ACI814_004975, partial [Mariniblastus sp.]